MAKAWLKLPTLLVRSNDRTFTIAGTGAAIKTPPAPTFLEPAAGQSFPVPAIIGVEVEHAVSYSLEFQAKHSALFQQPMSLRSAATTQAIELGDLKDIAGRATGRFVTTEPGRWWLRARSKFPYGEAPWSDWRLVTVGAPQSGPSPDKAAPAKPSQPPPNRGRNILPVRRRQRKGPEIAADPEEGRLI